MPQGAIFLLAIVLAGCAARGTALPPAVDSAESHLAVEIDVTVAALDFYRPANSVPRAVVILAHGFARDRTTLISLARDLAAADFAVLVPDLPAPFDQAANARFLVGLATMAGSGRIEGLDRAANVIFVGFSAGGGSSLRAAVLYGGALGWIGLDPVDRDGEAALAASALTAPAFILRAPAQSCNWQSNFLPAIGRLKNVLADRVIPVASHCDFESPTDAVCELVCRASSPERQRAIRVAVVAAALAIAPH